MVWRAGLCGGGEADQRTMRGGLRGGFQGERAIPLLRKIHHLRVSEASETG